MTCTQNWEVPVSYQWCHTETLVKTVFVTVYGKVLLWNHYRINWPCVKRFNADHVRFTGSKHTRSLNLRMRVSLKRTWSAVKVLWLNVPLIWLFIVIIHNDFIRGHVTSKSSHEDGDRPKIHLEFELWNHYAYMCTPQTNYFFLSHQSLTPHYYYYGVIIVFLKSKKKKIKNNKA